LTFLPGDELPGSLLQSPYFSATLMPVVYVLGAGRDEALIRVIAIDDHPLMLRAVVEELEGQPDIQVIGTGDHGSQLNAYETPLSVSFW
jgi:hypothetical protein